MMNRFLQDIRLGGQQVITPVEGGELLDKLKFKRQDIIQIKTSNSGDVAVVLLNYGFDLQNLGMGLLNFKTEELDYTTKEEELNTKTYLTLKVVIVDISRGI